MSLQPLPIDIQLSHILTDYDCRQSKKKFYNMYALGIMLQAKDRAMEIFQSGKSLRFAILECFNDRLCDFILKKLDLPLMTKVEAMYGNRFSDEK